jgi:hypothetical protein
VLVHQNTIKLADFGVNPKRFDNYSLFKDDVYRIGILLWEISSGRPPREDENRHRLTSILNTPEDYVKIYTGKYDIKCSIMIKYVLMTLSLLLIN